MPETAESSDAGARPGQADWSGQASAYGGAQCPPADDWLRAELDDEYPLPPMPAPRPRLTPHPPAAPVAPATPVAPSAPNFGAAAQPTSAPLAPPLSQPFAPPAPPLSPALAASAPPAVSSFAPPAPAAPAPTAPPIVGGVPAAPQPPAAPQAVAPTLAPPAPGSAPAPTGADFGAPTGQPGGHDQREQVEQPLPDWVIVLADGVSLPIYGPVIIGRNPSQDRFPEASISAVADLTQTMSKTHARFRTDGARLYVDDLNSTNGVALFPGGNAHGALAVEPGVPAELRSGDVVQLGEYRLSIRRS